MLLRASFPIFPLQSQFRNASAKCPSCPTRIISRLGMAVFIRLALLSAVTGSGGSFSNDSRARWRGVFHACLCVVGCLIGWWRSALTRPLGFSASSLKLGGAISVVPPLPTPPPYMILPTRAHCAPRPTDRSIRYEKNHPSPYHHPAGTHG